MNKIDSTLVYNTETRKIGINTMGTQTFGNITTGTIGCGAIRSSGNFTNETNTLTTGTISCGAIKSTGNFTNGTNTLTTGAITSPGAFTNGTNTLITDAISSSGALSCTSINSQGITTNNNNINAGTGIIAREKLYIAHGTTAGWNVKCLVVSNAGVVGDDGFAVFDKNSGGGSSTYYRMGFNSGFDFNMGNYENTINSSWVEAVKFNYGAPLNSLVVASSGFTGIGQVPTYRLTVAFVNTFSSSTLFN